MQATKPRKYYVPHGISGGGGRKGDKKHFLIHPKKTSDLTHIVLRGAMRELALLLVYICVCVENNLLVGVSEGSLSLPRLRN